MPEQPQPNIRAIRDLLVRAFSIEELRGLFRFAENHDLRPVADQFTPEDGKPAMARKAVEYCQSRFLLDELLEEIKDANPRAYERFKKEPRRRPMSANPTWIIVLVGLALYLLYNTLSSSKQSELVLGTPTETTVVTPLPSAELAPLEARLSPEEVTIAPLEAQIASESVLTTPWWENATFNAPQPTPSAGGRPIAIPAGTTGSFVEPAGVWSVLDVVKSGLIGLSVKLAFNAYYLEGVPCQAVASFHYASGEALPDLNKQYRTEDNKVASWVDFMPQYSGAAYDELEIFLPYDELHLGTVTAGLRYCVRVWAIEHKVLLGEFDCVNFPYSR